MLYKYITDNNLEEKQNYMYSEYGGREFLDAYKESRDSFLLEIKACDTDVHVTYIELMRLDSELNKKELWDNNRLILNDYIKTFEVRKRLYSEYNLNWKPCNNATYDNVELYIVLAQCLVKGYSLSKSAKYLSCLLKLDDTLISIKEKLTDRQKAVLSDIIVYEMQETKKLENKILMEN
ncbi:MAG: hypothetical protein IJ661_04590 [Lachnospiraceae bacterium]|nr:hypothetical protein [Lachnospiraceae bacterium]